MADRYRGVSVHCDTDGISPTWNFAGGGVLPRDKAFGSSNSEEGCRRQIDAILHERTTDIIKGALDDIAAGLPESATARLRDLQRLVQATRGGG